MEVYVKHMGNIEVVDVEELTRLERKLEEISKYLPKIKLQSILDLAREDITEVQSLSRELKEEKLLDSNYKTKKLKVSLSKKRNVQSRIMEIYVILDDELQNWRELYLKLKDNSMNV